MSGRRGTRHIGVQHWWGLKYVKSSHKSVATRTDAPVFPPRPKLTSTRTHTQKQNVARTSSTRQGELENLCTDRGLFNVKRSDSL